MKSAFNAMKLGGASALALAMSMSAACSGDGREPVDVSFGDGQTTVYLRALATTQTAGAATTITADVESDLPGTYKLEANIKNPREYEIKLFDTTGEISHTLRVGTQSLDIEFTRPTWVRSESLSFATPEIMNEWLAAHAASGSTACTALPERFQDMPLQYAVDALAGHLVASRSVALDLERKQQIMCAQASDVSEGANEDNSRGFAAWEDLRAGRLVAPKTPAPADDGQQAFKSTCPSHTSTIDRIPSINGRLGNTGNLTMTCSGGRIDLDARCCEGDDIRFSEYSTQTSSSDPAAPFCNGVRHNGVQTRYADFRFHGQSSVCPGGIPATSSTCTANGRIDTVTPYSCTFGGFSDVSGYNLPWTIGAPSETGNGVAAWSFLRFAVRLCYVPGTSSDVVACQNRSVDTRKPSTSICDQTNLADCFCQ